MPRRSGFTLIEILVVLILMGLAAALVAPALLPHHHDQSALSALLGSAREVAARRGEVVYLHIDPTGQWRMEAGANPLAGTLATGSRSEEHTSELQSQSNLVCRLLLEKKKNMWNPPHTILM